MKLRDIAIGANASIYYRLNFNRIKGVFYPRDEQDVIMAIRNAREKNFDVTPKGAGTGLSGACTGGDRERIMLSSLKMKRIISVSKEQGFIDVQPGVTPDQINNHLRPMGMRLYVAPSSRDIATVGGILSTDGGGNDTWVNGTMRDNTQQVKIVDYLGNKHVIDWEGVTSSDKTLEEELNRQNMTIHDIASSHGTLGFITELRLTIKPIIDEDIFGLKIEYSDNNETGFALNEMKKRTLPVRYGEVIAAVHEDIRGDLNPPVHIIECPEVEKCEIEEFAEVRELSKEELDRMRHIRIKLPKRNPIKGNQMALFEGYGFHSESLLKMQDIIDEINKLLKSHNLESFSKYGHGPSKWYLGNNTPAYGIVLHSREIRPEGKSGQDLYQAVLDIVDLCEHFGVTPKPEHKWIFSDTIKLTRIKKLREIIGDGFNGFILDPDCNDVLASMV